MENTTNGIQNEAKQDSSVDIMEVVIGIPVDAALIKISVLSPGKDGYREHSGKFDLEQIAMARMKFLQMTEGINGRETEETETAEPEGEEDKGKDIPENTNPTEQEAG